MRKLTPCQDADLLAAMHRCLTVPLVLELPDISGVLDNRQVMKQGSIWSSLALVTQIMPGAA